MRKAKRFESGSAQRRGAGFWLVLAIVDGLLAVLFTALTVLRNPVWLIPLACACWVTVTAVQMLASARRERRSDSSNRSGGKGGRAS